MRYLFLISLVYHNLFAWYIVNVNPGFAYVYCDDGYGYVDGGTVWANGTYNATNVSRVENACRGHDCPELTVLSDGVCKDDANSNSVPDDIDIDADTDNDGIPNGADSDWASYNPDLDYDNDGIKNGFDPDPNDSSITGSTSVAGCSGYDSTNFVQYGIRYPRSSYKYEGKTALGGSCHDYFQSLSSSNEFIDGALEYYDIDETCENSYCFIHNNKPDCNYKSSDYKPDEGLWYYRPNESASSCQYLVGDGKPYDDFIYTLPDSTNCPNTKFCFVHKDTSDYEPEKDDVNVTNPTIEDFNNTNPNLDLAPLLESQNNTNVLIESTNDKLNELNKNISNINDTSIETLNSINAVSDNTKNLDTSLSLINDTILNTSQNEIDTISTLNKSVTKLNSSMDNIDNTLKNIDSDFENYFTGDNPFDTEYTDGSETFNEVGDTIEASFTGFYLTDPIGLTAGSYTIPTYSFNLLGENFVLFDESFMAGLPIDLIRGIFLFIAAMAGIMTTFRSI